MSKPGNLANKACFVIIPWGINTLNLSLPVLVYPKETLLFFMQKDGTSSQKWLICPTACHYIYQDQWDIVSPGLNLFLVYPGEITHEQKTKRYPVASLPYVHHYCMIYYLNE